MKISSIHINDYNQFKDFRLDLTYPQGHSKAGQPLDKVCIIGQSGTGKTSLLLFIKKVLNFLGEGSRFSLHEDGGDSFFDFYKFRMVFKGDPDIFSYLTFSSFTEVSISHSAPKEKEVIVLGLRNKYIIENEAESSGFVFMNGSRVSKRIMLIKEFLRTYSFGYLYFPADLINPNDVPKEVSQSNESNFQGIDLGGSAAQSYWEKILEEIKAYEEAYIEKSVELSKNEKLRPAFEEWLKTASNPLETLATEFLDDILKKFNLRVKQDASFRRKEDIGTIKIETLQGVEVPVEAWSTGTKHLIFSALPLFALKPEKKIILFDEPERSLYPDIQTQLISTLTKDTLTTDCQFFFATHSPLLVSSFEPWEVVELKFKEDGSVYQELYFEGERHVDNYFVHPKLLRWDGILQRIFDLDEASNPERVKVLVELAMLKKTLEKKDISDNERKQKWEKYRELATKLNWDFDELDKVNA